MLQAALVFISQASEISANLQINITLLQCYEFTTTVSKLIAMSISFQWRANSNKKYQQLVQEDLSAN